MGPLLAPQAQHTHAMYRWVTRSQAGLVQRIALFEFEQSDYRHNFILFWLESGSARVKDLRHGALA